MRIAPPRSSFAHSVTRALAPVRPSPPSRVQKRTRNASTPTWRDRSRGARTCARGCWSARPATTTRTTTATAAPPPSPPRPASTCCPPRATHCAVVGNSSSPRAARGASSPSWGACGSWAGRAPRRRGGGEGAARTRRGRRISGTRWRRSRCGIRRRRRRRRRRWIGGGTAGRGRRRCGRRPTRSGLGRGRRRPPPPGRRCRRRDRTPSGFAAPSRPRRRPTGTSSCQRGQPPRRGGSRSRSGGSRCPTRCSPPPRVVLADAVSDVSRETALP